MATAVPRCARLVGIGAGVLVLLTLAGCSGSAGSTSAHPVAATTLNSILLAETPRDYTADTTLTGALDLDAASYSTPGAPSEVKSALLRNHFAGAFTHVWRSGDDYATDAVYALDSAREADALRLYLVSTVDHNPAAYPYTVPVPASATGFVLSAKNKTGDKFIFCQGAIFAVDVYVFLVETCGLQPNNNALDASLAQKQYERALAAQFSSEASPSPGR